MRYPQTSRFLLAMASVAVMGLTAGPSLAQSTSVPCSAFSRNGSGGWRVTGPVMLDLGGRLLAPMVGTTFNAGSTMHGIEMSTVLDRECGNTALR
jgi:hypothetical protein